MISVCRHTVGLARFRDTVAEFSGFQVGAGGGKPTPPEVLAGLQKTIAGFMDKEVTPKDLQPLLKVPGEHELLPTGPVAEQQAEQHAARGRSWERTWPAERSKGDEAPSTCSGRAAARQARQRTDAEAYRAEVSRQAEVVMASRERRRRQRIEA